MFFEELEHLRQCHLMRVLRDRDLPGADTQEPASPLGSHSNTSRIIIKGIEYINFSSNDYLGLAQSPLLKKAAKEAIKRHGTGSGASRLLSGGTELHARLERAIASFKGTKAALVFNSGYSANTSALPALGREGDAIFSDERNHASIIDGCRLSNAQKFVYGHKDVEHLSRLLKREHAKRKIVATDSVFSMDGDLAPLREIYALCKEQEALLYVDDAHATGVFGGGRGSLAHFNLRPEPWVIQMGTFSKALGSFGAYIAADEEVIEWLISTARGFIYSTALPSCVIAASLAALELIERDQSLITKLWQNRGRALLGIKALGLSAGDSESPILPLFFGSLEETLKAAERLAQCKIYAPAIRPPSVKEPRIRVAVSAAHSDDDIDTLLTALSELRA